MIPTDFYSASTREQTNMLMGFTIEQLSLLSKSSDVKTKRVKIRIAERLNILTIQRNREDEYIVKFKGLIKLLDEGWVKKYAINEVGLSYKVASRLIKESNYQYRQKTTSELKKMKGSKNIKDRLHYHKWDGSLSINTEFFESIEDM